jgi:hypothetical protein
LVIYNFILSSSRKRNAGIVNFKFKDYNSAVEDLSSCVKRDKKNSSAHTYLVSPNTIWYRGFFLLSNRFIESFVAKNIKSTHLVPVLGFLGLLV